MTESEIYKWAGYYNLDPDVLLDMDISGLPDYLEGLKLKDEELLRRWAVMLEALVNKIESLRVLTNNLHNKRQTKYRPVNLVDGLLDSEKTAKEKYYEELIARKRAKQAKRGL